MTTIAFPGGSGRLLGRVTVRGAGVPEIVLTLAGGACCRTDADGCFRFDAVPGGLRSLRMAVPAGYRSVVPGSEHAVVPVGPGSIAHVEFELVERVPACA